MANELGALPHERYLIGALLHIPAQVIRRRVAAAAGAAGFRDWRPTHAAVFMWLSPEGDRISALAEQVGVSKQAMGETIQQLARQGYV
ncbi:MAG: MarR family transcriptional regulator, partial [Chloroflexota bacterium]